MLLIVCAPVLSSTWWACVFVSEKMPHIRLVDEVFDALDFFSSFLSYDVLWDALPEWDVHTWAKINIINVHITYGSVWFTFGEVWEENTGKIPFCIFKCNTNVYYNSKSLSILEGFVFALITATLKPNVVTFWPTFLKNIVLYLIYIYYYS